MPKEKEDLFLTVLKSLEAHKVLKELVLLGDGCLICYRDLFGGAEAIPAPTTLDMDLLVLHPKKAMAPVDVSKLLQSMDFEEQLSYATGFSKFTREELSVEFLMPVQGDGGEKVYQVQSLSMGVQGVRNLNFTEEDLMTLPFRGLQVRVPRPEVFTLLKILSHEERRNPQKQERDLETARQLADFLMSQDDYSRLFRQAFGRLTRKQQKALIRITHDKGLPINNLLLAP